MAMSSRTFEYLERQLDSEGAHNREFEKWPLCGSEKHVGDMAGKNYNLNNNTKR